jgi:hypothetical protein
LKSYTILFSILALLGLYGALKYSAVFFGLFTVGFFLALYNYKTEEKNLPVPQYTEEKNIHMPVPQSTPLSASVVSLSCPNCQMELDAGVAFCPRCDAKVRKD